MVFLPNVLLCLFEVAEGKIGVSYVFVGFKDALGVFFAVTKSRLSCQTSLILVYLLSLL